MRVATDGRSIDVTEQEAIKLATLGFVFVCEADGRVIAIMQKDKLDVSNDKQEAGCNE